MPFPLSGLTGSGSSSSTSSSGRGTAAAAAALPEDLRSPSYAIATANAVMFLACALVPLLPASAVLLNHKAPQIWQLLTSSFAHPSLESVMQVCLVHLAPPRTAAQHVQRTAVVGCSKDRAHIPPGWALAYCHSYWLEDIDRKPHADMFANSISAA